LALDDAHEGSDSYSVEGRSWNLLTNGIYPGPFWDVLDLKGDQLNRHGQPFPPSMRWLQWVGKYQLLYREDGGRTWHTLGVLPGNVDATGEVTHDVRGLRARYLRFVPLEVTGGGAMRIGVFGTACASMAARGAAALGGRGVSGGDDPPEPITYTLRTCPTSVNTKYTYHAGHTYNGGRKRQWWYVRHGLVRRAARLHAWREVTEEEELGWQGLAERHEVFEGPPHVDGKLSEALVAACAVADAARPRPVMLDDNENEQMQLALALSLSEMVASETASVQGAFEDEQCQASGSELGSEAALVDVSDATSDAWSEVAPSEWSDMGYEDP